MLKMILPSLLCLLLLGCSNSNEDDSSNTPAEVDPLPIAVFTTSINGRTVTVDASGSYSQNTNAQLEFSWNFDEQFTGSGQTTSYTFTSDGEKTISLVVKDGNSVSLPVSDKVTVMSNNHPPESSFTVQTNGLYVTVNASGSVDVDGDNLSYKWDINGEATSSAKTFTYHFSSAGEKQISLTVNDGKLDSTKVSKIVTLKVADNTPENNPPMASFTVQTDGLQITLDASGSTDADGDNLSYNWNINGEATSSAKTFTYHFSSAGDKQISLTVNDGKLDSTKVSRIVTLKAADNTPENNRPMASFTVQTDGLQITLDASGSSDADGDNLSYKWDINGEASRTSQKVTYSFSSAGDKQVSLTVNDGKVESTKVSKIVKVSDNNPPANIRPTASFTVQTNGLQITLDASGSTDGDGDNLSYKWNINGEANRTEKTLTYDFSTAGDKTISLIVNDGTEDSLAQIQTVTVKAPETGYETALAAITPRIKSECLFCHGSKPANGVTINFATAASPEEVKQGIVSYLKANPSKVSVVKDTPVSAALRHSGLTPFANDPDKSNWIKTIDGIAGELVVPDMGKGEIIFSEDYESQTAGQNPDGWGVNYQYNINNNPSPTQYADSIKVTDTIAHNGSKALYVNGKGLSSAMRYSFKKLNLPGGIERVFVRYYVRSTQYIGYRAKNPDGSQPNHNDFMSLSSGQGKEIRIGEIKGALGVNEYGNDDIVPKYEYWYGQIETPRINANTWHCVETAFLNDGPKPELKTWLDDILVTHIDDQTDFKNGAAIEKWLDDRFGQVNFGWANYGTYDTEIYFDDIVVSTERVGCL